jgi:hypothetical protein
MQDKKSLPIEQLTFETTVEGKKVKLVIQNISFDEANNIINIRNIEGYLLVKNGE